MQLKGVGDEHLRHLRPALAGSPVKTLHLRANHGAVDDVKMHLGLRKGFTDKGLELLAPGLAAVQQLGLWGDFTSAGVELLAPHLGRAVAYELEPGGAGVHGPWAPHCSGPNRSGVDRHVLVLRYVDAEAQARRGELLWRVVENETVGEFIEVPWEAEPPSDGDGGGEEAREPKRRRAEPGALAEYVCWSTGERIDRHCYVLET